MLLEDADNSLVTVVKLQRDDKQLLERIFAAVDRYATALGTIQDFPAANEGIPKQMQVKCMAEIARNALVTQ